MEKKKNISHKELGILQNSSDQKVKIIDVRSKEEFDAQHIPEAVNVPLEKLDAYLKGIDRNMHVVTVCNRGGAKSQGAQEKCSITGFDNSQYLEGGTLGWFEENPE